MPVLDRREPGVYVSIEDASYASSSLEIGRTVYTVGLCPQGPHNRVVEITGGRTQFYKLFGKPNFNKTSQTHYLADKALQYGARLLYVRVMPEDSELAHVSITGTSAAPTTNNDAVFTTAIIPVLTISQDFVLTTAISKGNIVYKRPTNQYFKYNADVALPIGATLVYKKLVVNATWLLVTNNSNKITSTKDGFSSLSVGDWVYYQDDTPSCAKQIISIDNTSSPKVVTLNEDYVSTSHPGSQIVITCVDDIVTPENNKYLYKYEPLKTSHDTLPQDNVYKDDKVNDTTNDVFFTFYSIGAGEYGNNYKVVGSRNSELEKMYLDDNGNVKYKYLFVNIGVYEIKDDGTTTLKEGPFVTSLLERTPNENVLIRDLSSGSPMYIVDVINRNSELIRIAEGNAAPELQYESIRLQMISILADNVTGSSMIFANGKNGTADYNVTTGDEGTVDLYNPTTGYLQYDDYIYGQMKNAFTGSLVSPDDSIESILEVTYPLYNINYILSGGLPAWVQDGARYLAEYREDSIHLGDTGMVSENYHNDLTLRITHVSWNNWTSALYVQYRKIKDAFTGLDMWITPVYHAIERHLAIDGIAFIAEPVAGIEKGAITEPIELRYKANHIQRGDLIENELNPVIVEPDGTYILTQFTTWKRLSVMKRLHVAKFVAYCRQMIPPLVKDLIQRRATPYWIKQGESRVNYFLSQFCGSNNERYNILQSYTVTTKFDDTSSELNIYITLKPFRAIEKINVFIAVQ